MHPDYLNELRQLLDFGLVVLLWLVQRIIYPSFSQVVPERLVEWHAHYTQRVGYIVVPLMFGQLGLSVLAVWQVGGGLDWLDLLLVLSCWGLTFGFSVPLHQQIAAGESQPQVLQRLVLTNWPRTLVWTVIFALGFWR
ncbi:MAG: hypothetical protein P8R37_12755 [Opitutae bacterium]|jgi:hypothetical protein|nr:hypothetical protein [Opitutae bacterium]MDG1302446.1 hypothetical protein [Opitutae bacterium]